MVTAKPSSSSLRYRGRWAWATAATTVLAASSACPAAAFAPPAPMYNRHKGRSSSRRFAVTDPDILLRDVRLRSSGDVDMLEKAYMSSADFAEPLLDGFEEEAQPATVSALPKRTKKTKKKAPPVRAKKSRSSTMPGFSERSSREQAFQDGIKLMELQSGKQFTETVEAKKKRKKNSSEQMYKTSASVPDSLVRFANEIHLVSA